MAIWNITNPEELANTARTGGQRTIHPSAYHARFTECSPSKTQSGADKWTIKWTLIGAETEEARMESVGAERTQHFVVGHSDSKVAKGYQADFLHILKLCGVDISKINNEGDLFMTARELTSSAPVICFYLEPQAKDPKYLNWYPKGRVQGNVVIDKDGNQLGIWGLPQGETPAAVQSEAKAQQTAPAFDEIPF